MSEELRSVLVGTAGLGLVAVVALALTLARPFDRHLPAAARVPRLAALAIAAQAAHFAEELTQGFPPTDPPPCTHFQCRQGCSCPGGISVCVDISTCECDCIYH